MSGQCPLQQAGITVALPVECQRATGVKRARHSLDAELFEPLGDEQCILVDQGRIAVTRDGQVAVERAVHDSAAAGKGGHETMLGA